MKVSPPEGAINSLSTTRLVAQPDKHYAKPVISDNSVSTFDFRCGGGR